MPGSWMARATTHAASIGLALWRRCANAVRARRRKDSRSRSPPRSLISRARAQTAAIVFVCVRPIDARPTDTDGSAGTGGRTQFPFLLAPIDRSTDPPAWRSIRPIGPCPQAPSAAPPARASPHASGRAGGTSGEAAGSVIAARRPPAAAALGRPTDGRARRRRLRTRMHMRPSLLTHPHTTTPPTCPYTGTTRPASSLPPFWCRRPDPGRRALKPTAAGARCTPHPTPAAASRRKPPRPPQWGPGGID